MTESSEVWQSALDQWRSKRLAKVPASREIPLALPVKISPGPKVRLKTPILSYSTADGEYLVVKQTQMAEIPRKTEEKAVCNPRLVEDCSDVKVGGKAEIPEVQKQEEHVDEIADSPAVRQTERAEISREYKEDRGKEHQEPIEITENLQNFTKSSTAALLAVNENISQKLSIVNFSSAVNGNANVKVVTPKIRQRYLRHKCGKADPRRHTPSEWLTRHFPPVPSHFCPCNQSTPEYDRVKSIQERLKNLKLREYLRCWGDTKFNPTVSASNHS